MQTVIRQPRWMRGISLNRLREISRRAADEDKRFAPFIAPMPRVSNGGRPRRGVRIGDHEYISMREAMLSLGVSSANMCAALRRGYVVLRVKVDATYLYAP